MPFTDEQKQKIADALAAKRKEHTAAPITCPICSTTRWTLVDDMVNLTLQPKANTVTLSGPTLPLIAIICVNCGNTHLLNVFVLGLAEVLGVKAVAQPRESQGKGNG